MSPTISSVSPALTVIQIEERLDELLGAVLSSRRTAAEPADALASLDRSLQNFALHWAYVISKSNSEMAFQFVSHVSGAFDVMDTEGVMRWIIESMDVYDRQGLYPGSASIRDFKSFATRIIQNRYSVGFDEVVGVLNKYIKGVSGRSLDINVDNRTWTDSETIFLPQDIGLFDSKKLNFLLYKVTGAFLLAQIRYGTFRADINTGIPLVCSAIAKYRDQAKALQIFETIEEVRLTAQLKRELPGLVRQMNELRATSGDERVSENLGKLLDQVRKDNADVLDSLQVLEEVYRSNIAVPDPACYQSVYDLERVRLVTRQRIEREKDKFRTDLALIAESVEGQKPEADDEANPNDRKVSMTTSPDLNELGEWEMTLTIDGQPVTPPDDMIQTANSIIQDFGEIPEDYLVPAGDGQYRGDSGREDDEPREGVRGNEEAFYYQEWDYRRSHYRKNWCVLRELEMHPSSERFVESILEKYSHLIQEIRKSFEVLRGDDRMLRKQKNGDDIDIDAVVESYVDVVQGNEMSDRLFVKSRKLERDLAVIFMVDVSGSTKGWINDAERESLVLLSEALETLGDRYAIYGFSGMTRKRCELYRIKEFEESYSDLVKARIAGIRPQDYTRMGVIIRHLSAKLLEVDARTRVLITLSDGKPDDYDGYRGDYGIEDTRQALMEAKYAGIHPFCITIDSQAHDYLPHMYGHVNYTVVNDVRKLPLKVSDIYRKLTT